VTSDERFGRSLTVWLEDDARGRVPGHLDEVLLRTVATRQRRWWSSLERWLPVNIASTRVAVPRPPLFRIALVAALVIVAVLALALIAGAERRVPPPFGLARNGDFLFGANGDILRFDPATGTSSPVIAGATWDFGPTFSRDGTRFAFGRVPGDPAWAAHNADLGMVTAIANADGSNVRELTTALPGNCWSDWHPDGRHLVFRTERPDHYGLLNVLDVDAGTLRTIDPGISVRCGPLGYLPPSGDEIVFRGDTTIDHGVFSVRSDGTGLRRRNTALPVCDCDTGLLSPDGRYLAIDRWDTAGRVRLWLLDLGDGTERLVPLPEDHFSRGGAFSPDGSRIAFPMLHAVAPNQKAYQVATAPVDGTSPARALGPEIKLPATGTDEAFVSIAFSPDGQTLIAVYPDSPTSVNDSIWLLPLDGSAGRTVGSGTFASLDIQRRAP
jgi:Tol biopolymer transport system component